MLRDASILNKLLHNTTHIHTHTHTHTHSIQPHIYTQTQVVSQSLTLGNIFKTKLDLPSYSAYYSKIIFQLIFFIISLMALNICQIS